MEWEKIFAHNTTERGLLCKVDKHPESSTALRRTIMLSNMGRGDEQTVPGDRHMGRQQACGKTLVVTHCQGNASQIVHTNEHDIDQEDRKQPGFGEDLVKMGLSPYSCQRVQPL